MRLQAIQQLMDFLKLAPQVVAGCHLADRQPQSGQLTGQILGVGLGLFDTLLPLVLADVMRGTGRYNVSRGVIGTIQGIGGSLSNGVAGLIVVRAGYDAAFLALAALAAMAVFLIWIAMPETRGSDDNVAEVHNDA